MAVLEKDAQKSEIHLTDRSSDTPEFSVCCRDKLPSLSDDQQEHQKTATRTHRLPFQRILVPLDGSIRSERALPVAACIARIFGGSLVIMQSILPSQTTARYASGVVENARASATHYLNMVAQSKDLSGTTITPDIFIGHPEEMIFAAARLHQSDLIVMCSKGQTGLKRWALGSVTQKVARSSPVPVLVLRDDNHLRRQERTNTPQSIRVMVALDGSQLAEATLAPAAYLSTALSAPARGALHIVRILHLPSTFEYGQNDSVAQAIQQETPPAMDYLHTIEQQLRESEFASLNLQITTALDHDLDCAGKLLKLAEQGEGADGTNVCDLMALATHGRSGPKRWVMGSVAERVLNTTHLPTLIVRPQKTQGQTGKAGQRVGTRVRRGEVSSTLYISNTLTDGHGPPLKGSVRTGNIEAHPGKQNTGGLLFTLGSCLQRFLQGRKPIKESASLL
jgi:nucleotide-binding universal stress UspA family protein